MLCFFATLPNDIFQAEDSSHPRSSSRRLASRGNNAVMMVQRLCPSVDLVRYLQLSGLCGNSRRILIKTLWLSDPIDYQAIRSPELYDMFRSTIYLNGKVI